MTWPDENVAPGWWWRDAHDVYAQFVPWPAMPVDWLPKKPNGCFDYDEIACLREQVWAEREGLA